MALVAEKMVLQIAVRDIGQLTDLWRTGLRHAAAKTWRR
jgi:hypothetical protein